MPYIVPDQRPEFDQTIKLLHKDLVASGHSAAKLNYIICCLVNKYVEYFGLRYQTICEVQGVFKGAAGEFKRVVADVYEARKEEENGTVWTCMDDFAPPPLPKKRPNEPDDIYDESTNQHWMPCTHPLCNIHLTGPGRIDCSGYCLEDDDWNQ